MRVRTKWVVLWTLWAARLVRQPTVVRHLPEEGAALRGQLAPDGSHEQYFGIPYASSRYQFRFQAPGPAVPWDGILEAVEENIKCPQAYGDDLVLGSEECLTLNIYKPVQAGSLKPVMVFIHGGGFKEGSGSRLLYGADYLVAKNVLVVTFNYRLNVHGFLCLGIKEAPGNVGLKDQVAALKWIQRNIRAFGGDPDNVTIFGESAGGASVSYHLLSPMSKGLFHKAIIQSGSSTAAWARQRAPLVVAASLAQALGHHVTDPHQIYSITMNTTLSDLINAKLPRKRGQMMFSHLPFTPCTERELDGVEAFLTDTPYNILKGGDYNKVPVMIGSNDEEGYFFAAMENEDSLRNIDFEAVLQGFDLTFPSESERQGAAQRLQELYMGDANVSLQTILKLSRLHGEPYFILPALIETELLLETSDKPVYSYLFRYDGWRNFPKLISGLTFWMAAGATHADDLFYLFNLFPVPSLFETKMINTMTTLWTDFAKYGEPTPPGSAVRWPAARPPAPAARPPAPAARAGPAPTARPPAPAARPPAPAARPPAPAARAGPAPTARPPAPAARAGPAPAARPELVLGARPRAAPAAHSLTASLRYWRQLYAEYRAH